MGYLPRRFDATKNMRAFLIRQLFLVAALIGIVAIASLLAFVTTRYSLFAVAQNSADHPLTAKLRELQQRENQLSALPSAKARTQIAEIDARYREIIREHPDAIDARDNYGEFLWQAHRARASIAQMKIAERLDPQNADRAEDLGATYFAVGDIVSAKKELVRAVELAPRSAYYHSNLANFLLTFRHDLAPANRELAVFHEALEQFRLAAAFAPKNVDYQRGYAETFYSMPDADWTAALAAWENYLRVSPHKDFARLNIARVCIRLHRFDQARAALTAIHDPRFFDAKSKIGKQIPPALSEQKGQK